MRDRNPARSETGDNEDDEMTTSDDTSSGWSRKGAALPTYAVRFVDT